MNRLPLDRLEKDPEMGLEEKVLAIAFAMLCNLCINRLHKFGRFPHPKIIRRMEIFEDSIHGSMVEGGDEMAFLPEERRKAQKLSNNDILCGLHILHAAGSMPFRGLVTPIMLQIIEVHNPKRKDLLRARDQMNTLIDFLSTITFNP